MLHVETASDSALSLSLSCGGAAGSGQRWRGPRSRPRPPHAHARPTAPQLTSPLPPQYSSRNAMTDKFSQQIVGNALASVCQDVGFDTVEASGASCPGWSSRLWRGPPFGGTSQQPSHAHPPSSRPTAMDVFTQLVLKYVEAIGKLAKDQADLGERNVVNLHDIISAFAHLRPRADLESLNTYSLDSLVRFAHDPESERSCKFYGSGGGEVALFSNSSSSFSSLLTRVPPRLQPRK